VNRFHQAAAAASRCWWLPAPPSCQQLAGFSAAAAGGGIGGRSGAFKRMEERSPGMPKPARTVSAAGCFRAGAISFVEEQHAAAVAEFSPNNAGLPLPSVILKPLRAGQASLLSASNQIAGMRFAHAGDPHPGPDVDGFWGGSLRSWPQRLGKSRNP